MSAVLAALAPAKVNLSLRIVGRRADGYHELDSLVVFAPFGDRLVLRLGPQLGLKVSGPTAAQAGELGDNLVLRAARAAADRIEGLRLGTFSLTKRLPAGAGLGGGSADAAAALRLIAQANDLDLADARIGDAARVTGADVPVCLDPKPCLMRGIGDILSPPLVLPRFGMLIVHPGIGVSTKSVFGALGLAVGERCGVTLSTPPEAADRSRLLAWLASAPNDLEAPAIRVAPPIADVLAAIAELPGCRLARMSGSGSACFGLFDSARVAAAAATVLAAAHPGWWARSGLIGTVSARRSSA